MAPEICSEQNDCERRQVGVVERDYVNCAAMDLAMVDGKERLCLTIHERTDVETKVIGNWTAGRGVVVMSEKEIEPTKEVKDVEVVVEIENVDVKLEGDADSMAIERELALAQNDQAVFPDEREFPSKISSSTIRRDAQRDSCCSVDFDNLPTSSNISPIRFPCDCHERETNEAFDPCTNAR